MENGIAYGFLYCSALKEELERELHGIKRATNIPDLDFLVMETTDLLKEDQIPISFAGVSDEADLRALTHLAKMADECELHYAVRATCPGETNNNVAHSLSHILMQANQSYLNKQGEVWGNVVYKNSDGEYVFFE